MIPVLLIGLAAVAALLTNGSGAFGPAIANLVVSFWANGVLANYSREEGAEAPNWAAALSMLTAGASVVLILVGLAS